MITALDPEANIKYLIGKISTEKKSHRMVYEINERLVFYSGIALKHTQVGFMRYSSAKSNNTLRQI